MKVTKQQILIAALTLSFVSFGTGYIVGTPHYGVKTQVEGQFNNGPGRADQRGAENPDGREFGKGGHRGFKGPDCGPGSSDQGPANGQQPNDQAPNGQQPDGQVPNNQAPAQNGNQDRNNNQNQNSNQQVAPQAPNTQSSDQNSDKSTEKGTGSSTTEKKSTEGTTQKK